MKYTTAQWTQSQWPYLTPKHYTLDQRALCGYEPETGAEFRRVPMMDGLGQQPTTCVACRTERRLREAAKEK